MKSASQLLHEHHGEQVVTGSCTLSDGTLCWICGSLASKGMPWCKWMGANFTNQDRVRAPSSEYVCEGCVWAMAGKPPNTLRMWTHLLDVGGDYHRVNKGSKPLICSFLRRVHDVSWLAAIADSGQKHMVPWTPVNPPGSRGRVMFEETIVVLPDEAGWVLVDDIATVLTSGATKDEMASGRYGAGAWQRCREQIRTFEATHGHVRGGSWFSLALWLAQRDEAVVAERMAAEKESKKGAGKTRKSKKQDGGVPVGGACSIPASRGEPPEALGCASNLSSIPTASLFGTRSWRATRRFGDRYITGIRGDESGPRKMRMKHHGIATARTCAPMGHWCGQDVYAYLHAHDLPVHPAYACTMGGVLDRNRVRVASLGGGRGIEYGRRQWEQTYYRSEIDALFAGRPEEGVL